MSVLPLLFHTFNVSPASSISCGPHKSHVFAMIAIFAASYFVVLRLPLLEKH